MPSRSRLSQITSEILQAIDKAPDVETAIESLALRAPTDPDERQPFRQRKLFTVQIKKTTWLHLLLKSFTELKEGFLV